MMPDLRRDREVALGRLLGEVDHLLGREDVRARVGVRHRLAGAAALGMHEQLGVGIVVVPALDVLGPDAGVHVALAHPEHQLAPGHLLEPEPEEEVGQEEDLLIGGDRLDHRSRALPEVQQ